MPTPPKAVKNMTKNLPAAERQLREQAERETIPARKRVKLKKPPFVSDNKAANAYWNQIVKRMEGLVLLDDLDSEMLAGYCSMLARRDQTILLINQLMELLGVRDAMDAAKRRKPAAEPGNAEGEMSGGTLPPGLTPDELIEAVSKLDTLNGKLQTLERNLLQYADKLGLTPAGRVRLAQKRAERAAAETEPEADLYGD